MTRQGMIAATAMAALWVLGCANNGQEAKPDPAPPVESSPPGEPSEPSDRASLTNAECEAQGGVIVGDIGDGAIHRPDYRCESGQPPIGTIRAAEGEPIGVEGSVCCAAKP